MQRCSSGTAGGSRYTSSQALGLHFIFHPENTEPGLHIRHKANPVDVLKTISRIVLRNFRSIRAYWVTLGTKLAQVALNYGANDLDGTLMGEHTCSGCEDTQLQTYWHLSEELIR